MNQKDFRVLFVCTGNSCRSPIAEGILKNYLKKIEIHNIVVESAGTMSPIGMAPTNHALLVTVERGIYISHHRSRSLTKEMVEKVDLILVMEKAHKHFIKKEFPWTTEKVFLLKEFAKENSEEEIEDPIGRDLEFYRFCYEELEREIRRVLPIILDMAGKERKEEP